MLKAITHRIDEWTPPELAGGLPGRCADDIHESLDADVQNIYDEGISIAGVEVGRREILRLLRP